MDIPHHIFPVLQGIQFGLPGFQSLLLTGCLLVSFRPPNKMLHFRGLLNTFIQGVRSHISGSMLACSYPELFAAYHVALLFPA